MPLVPLAPIARPIQGVRVQAAQQAVNTRADQQRVQAIQQAGGAVVGLLDRYNELTDTRNLVEAENEMRKATQDFNAWRLDPANADESQWLPKWEETQAAVQKKFDGLKLSDRARLGPSRCKPTRWTRPSRCRPTSRRASPVIPSFICKMKPRSERCWTRGAVRTLSKP